MARRQKKRQIKYFDYSLLFIIIFLICFGLVMLYSTSAYDAQITFKDPTHYLKRQGIFHADYVNSFLQQYLQKGDKGSGTGGNYSRMVWALFAFQQWYQTYMR